MAPLPPSYLDAVVAIGSTEKNCIASGFFYSYLLPGQEKVEEGGRLVQIYLVTNRHVFDYMMGHTVDTYHDIQSKGVEFLRNIYAGAALSIKPRTGISKIDMVKEFARGLGLNPENILVKHAFSEPETKYVDPQERERADIRALMQAIKADLVKANLSG
jgi:hypothetical protein